MDVCTAALPDIELDVGELHHSFNLAFSQEFAYQAGTETSVAGLSSLDSGSFFQTVGTSSLGVDSSAQYSAVTPDNASGFLASSTSIQDGVDAAVCFVGAGLPRPEGHLYLGLLVSPAEPIFPAGAEGSHEISDADYFNRSFPSLDQFVAPMAASPPPAADGSGSAHWPQMASLDLAIVTADRMTEPNQNSSGLEVADVSPAAAFICTNPKCEGTFANRSALR